MEEGFETMGDWMEKYNPFALKNAKGEVLKFESREAIYLYVMKEIRKYCKRGYVELALLVKHLTGFDDDTCNDVADYIKRLDKRMKEEPLLFDWDNVGYYRERLQAIMKGLHIITETEFYWAEFELAWEDFRVYNKNFDNGQTT